MDHYADNSKNPLVSKGGHGEPHVRYDETQMSYPPSYPAIRDIGDPYPKLKGPSVEERLTSIEKALVTILQELIALRSK